MKTLLLIASLMSSAYGKDLCKDHVSNGELKILKICAELGEDGSLNRPRLIDKNGMDWPIAPGVSPESRSDKICNSFGLGSAVDIKVGECSSEQATVNLRGNYAWQGIVWEFKCLQKIECGN